MQEVLVSPVERIASVLTAAGELTVTVEPAVAVGERVAVRLIDVAVELSVGTERQLSRLQPMEVCATAM